MDVDADAGVIANTTTGETFKAQPFPPFIREIIEEGGLINRTKEGAGEVKQKADAEEGGTGVDTF